ncbi:MAG: RpiB/LacA/LacB family sugar-phosphate isomerase [Alphaproteobacteria bacterium]|nr:RpiB/LacA/LacB family sugar-phosphate isomerase [Alphaproteobacteria bacterium]
MEIIALASDHRGFAYKSELITFIRDLGFTPLDLGAPSAERVDSQDFGVAAALALKDGRASRAIILCGSGNGIAIAANRFLHVRAALCPHVTAARMARQHNDANIMSLAADFMGYDLVKDCVETFLKTDFLGGRYAERVEKLNKLDPNKL